MIRSICAVALACALAACEDGPKQTFNPAPMNAGSQWNDGNPKPVTNPDVSQGFTGTVGGTNKQEICDGPTKMMKWAAAFAQPIIPPTHGGGLDMSGGTSWQAITLDQAE